MYIFIYIYISLYGLWNNVPFWQFEWSKFFMMSPWRPLAISRRGPWRAQTLVRGRGLCWQAGWCWGSEGPSLCLALLHFDSLGFDGSGACWFGLPCGGQGLLEFAGHGPRRCLAFAHCLAHFSHGFSLQRREVTKTCSWWLAVQTFRALPLSLIASTFFLKVPYYSFSDWSSLT